MMSRFFKYFNKRVVIVFITLTIAFITPIASSLASYKEEVVMDKKAKSRYLATSTCPDAGEEGWFECESERGMSQYQAQSSLIMTGISVMFAISFIVFLIVFKNIRKKNDELNTNIQEEVKPVVKSEETHICKYCGTKNSKDASKCSSCGARL